MSDIKPIIISEGYVPTHSSFSYTYDPLTTSVPFDISNTRDYMLPTVQLKEVPAWDSLSKPPTNYGSDMCTVVYKPIKVFDFYVDSLPISEITEETYSEGVGTMASPFRCLSHALYVLDCMYEGIFSALCDTYIMLHVRGVLDYNDFDIIEKYPQLEGTLIREYTRGDFVNVLIYDFEDCDVRFSNTIKDLRRAYVRFDRYIASLMCMNMTTDIANAYWHELQTALYACNITWTGSGPISFYDNIYKSDIKIYGMSKDTNNIDITASIVESQLYVSEVYRASIKFCYSSDVDIQLADPYYGSDSYATVYSLYGCNIRVRVTDGPASVYIDNAHKTTITATGIGVFVYNTTNSCIKADSDLVLQATAVDVYLASTDILPVAWLIAGSSYLNIDIHGNPTESWNHSLYVQPQYDKPFALYESRFTVHVDYTAYEQVDSCLLDYYYDDDTLLLSGCSIAIDYKLPSEYDYFRIKALCGERYMLYNCSIFDTICLDGSIAIDEKRECIEDCNGDLECIKDCKTPCERYAEDD